LDVGCNHAGEPPLQVADAAADFDGETAAASCGNQIVEVVVNYRPG
jgi:hypothetical protein